MQNEFYLLGASQVSSHPIYLSCCSPLPLHEYDSCPLPISNVLGLQPQTPLYFPTGSQEQQHGRKNLLCLRRLRPAHPRGDWYIYPDGTITTIKSQTIYLGTLKITDFSGTVIDLSDLATLIHRLRTLKNKNARFLSAIRDTEYSPCAYSSWYYLPWLGHFLSLNPRASQNSVVV